MHSKRTAEYRITNSRLSKDSQIGGRGENFEFAVHFVIGHFLLDIPELFNVAVATKLLQGSRCFLRFVSFLLHPEIARQIAD